MGCPLHIDVSLRVAPSQVPTFTSDHEDSRPNHFEASFKAFDALHRVVNRPDTCVRPEQCITLYIPKVNGPADYTTNDKRSDGLLFSRFAGIPHIRAYDHAGRRDRDHLAVRRHTRKFSTRLELTV